MLFGANTVNSTFLGRLLSSPYVSESFKGNGVELMMFNSSSNFLNPATILDLFYNPITKDFTIVDIQFYLNSGTRLFVLDLWGLVNDVESVVRSNAEASLLNSQFSVDMLMGTDMHTICNRIIGEIAYLTSPKTEPFNMIEILPEHTATLEVFEVLSVNIDNSLYEFLHLPEFKLYYPEPFIASPSFIHEELWFLHILHYQHWLWFFFISLIMIFFITFINVVRWCNPRNRPKRETRGVSRSKCADIITSAVPVSWAAAIIISESVDATDYYDGFGTGEIVVGIRAYQWGWEYFFPKNMDLNYDSNFNPTYAAVTGNSLKYVKSAEDNTSSGHLWKNMLAGSHANLASVPTHVLLSPIDNNKVLNFINFDNMGANTVGKANAFRKIQASSKATPQNLFNSASDFTLKYSRISDLYLSGLSPQDSLYYGNRRQHEYNSISSLTNNSSTQLDVQSVSKLLDYNYNYVSGKGSSLPDASPSNARNTILNLDPKSGYRGSAIRSRVRGDAGPDFMGKGRRIRPGKGITTISDRNIRNTSVFGPLNYNYNFDCTAVKGIINQAATSLPYSFPPTSSLDFKLPSISFDRLAVSGKSPGAFSSTVTAPISDPDNSIGLPFWVSLWANSKPSLRLDSVVRASNKHGSSIIPNIVEYGDYDYKDWQSVELVEDIFFHSTSPGYTQEEYRVTLKNSGKFYLSARKGDTCWDWAGYQYCYGDIWRSVPAPLKFFLPTFHLVGIIQRVYPVIIPQELYSRFSVGDIPTLALQYLICSPSAAPLPQPHTSVVSGAQLGDIVPTLLSPRDGYVDFTPYFILCLHHKCGATDPAVLAGLMRLVPRYAVPLVSTSMFGELSIPGALPVAGVDTVRLILYSTARQLPSNSAGKIAYRRAGSAEARLLLNSTIDPKCIQPFYAAWATALPPLKRELAFFGAYLSDGPTPDFDVVSGPLFVDHPHTTGVVAQPIYAEDSYSDSVLLELNSFGPYDNESCVDATGDPYVSNKFINYIYHLNYVNTLGLATNAALPFSYVQIFNPFREDFEESDNSLDSFHRDESTDNPTDSGNPTVGVEDSELRSSNLLKLRSTTKRAIKTFNALQLVFRLRFDEGRSNVGLNHLSATSTRYPLISEARVPYSQILGKNNESFFNTTSYKYSVSKLYSGINPVIKSLDVYFANIPFLLSMRSEPGRYIWFDWYSRWNSVEVQPSSVARYSLSGAPYFSRNFEYSVEQNQELRGSDTYLIRLSKARKNYLSNWALTPYMYSRLSTWYALNGYVRNTAGLVNLLHLRSTLFLSKNYWTGGNIVNLGGSYTPSLNDMGTPGRSSWKPTSSVQGYNYTVSALINLLTKREYLYREYFLNKGFTVNLPPFLIASPANTLLEEVKQSYSLADPTSFVGEVQRDLFYSNLVNSQLHVFTSLIDSQTLLTRLGAFNTPLLHLVHVYFGDNVGLNNDLYVNQFRPMRKGISNMVRLHATGAVAMPIEMRLHILASSKDIIHSWALPSAGIKIDCIPGYSSHRVAIFLVSGIFWGQCMEICGRFHHWMPIIVYFVKRDIFFLWCTHFVHQSIKGGRQSSHIRRVHFPNLTF